LGVYDDKLIPGLREMTEAVHREGGKIVLQLAHAGYHARMALTGTAPLAPSCLKDPGKSPRKEMNLEDIERVIDAFRKSAIRAKEAGFDGVQVHSAHGYLLSQFLSPFYNRRTDEYGGTIQNRARLLIRVVETIKEAVGPDYPVLVKMNCADFMDGGLILEDAVQVGKMLDHAGVDGIELSGGVLTGGKLSPSRMGISTEQQEAYFRNEACAFRQEISVPLMLVGGIRSYQVADALLNNNIADYFSMCRPFIREPGLVNRWKQGDLSRAKCISDNKCFAPAMQGKGIFCVTARKQEREKQE
jgi:2,4-dienoyl-CoA reductase-like NADH-dependent reductase (Old Yellow Enzyme family)